MSLLTRAVDRFLLLLLGKENFARRKGVTIGTGCRILSNLVTTEPWLVSIGDRVTVSSDVMFVTHDGSGWLVRDEKGRRFRYAPIEIGDDVFIGARSTILPGVKVGAKVVIGAGSVVTRSIPGGTVVGGVPARVITSWTAFEERVRGWPSGADMRGETYQERVDSIVEGLRP